MEAELRYLMGRLDVIRGEVGPDNSKKRKDKGGSGDNFMDLKTTVIGNLREISDMNVQMKDLHESGADHRERIALSMKMYDKLSDSRRLVNDMKALLDKERNKRSSKFEQEELEQRQQFVDNLKRQLDEAAKIIRTRGGAIEEEVADDDLEGGVVGAGLVSFEDWVAPKGARAEGGDADLDEEDDYVSGAGAGAGAGGRRGGGGGGGRDGGGEKVEEVLSQRQEQVLKQWEESKLEEDTKLGEIEAVLRDIGDLAEGVHDEAVKQGMILDELHNKVENVRGKLSTAQNTLSEQLKQARGADKLCMDIVCIVLLIGVATVIYNTVKDYIG